jgi:aryl-alcohol dehydrogenase-like predicted oxidoreductase
MTSPNDLPLAPTRPLADTGLTVSALCLGGNVFGWTAGPEESMVVLDAYAAAGGNFIDTADAYSSWIPGNVGGESEAIIGDWMTARGNRDDVIVATKIGKHPLNDGLAAANIRACAEMSLRRLRTDYIDLLYVHRDDEEVPMEETLGALDELVRAGKVRHIAASNFSAERLTQALDLSEREGLSRYVALQNHYNLMERAEYEDGPAAVVAERGLASLPYYSLARGFLTGKYRGAAEVSSARAAGARKYLNEQGEAVLDVLSGIAAAQDTTLAAVALAWLLAQPTITAPIASARTVEQLDQIIDLDRVTLGEADLAALNAASR